MFAGNLLPLIGPPTTASGLPRDRLIYVSRGVGVERGQAPRLRLGAVPDVSLIDLR